MEPLNPAAKDHFQPNGYDYPNGLGVQICLSSISLTRAYGCSFSAALEDESFRGHG